MISRFSPRFICLSASSQAGNELVATDAHLERMLRIQTFAEHLPVEQAALVEHRHHVPGLGGGVTRALLEDDVAQAGGGLDGLGPGFFDDPGRPTAAFPAAHAAAARPTGPRTGRTRKRCACGEFHIPTDESKDRSKPPRCPAGPGRAATKRRSPRGTSPAKRTGWLKPPVSNDGCHRHRRRHTGGRRHRRRRRRNGRRPLPWDGLR